MQPKWIPETDPYHLSEIVEGDDDPEECWECDGTGECPNCDTSDGCGLCDHTAYCANCDGIGTVE